MRADQTKLGPAEALALTTKVTKVVSAKGKKVDTLDLPADREAILALLIGPTGNLRAPAAVVGTTLVVGFHPAAYDEVLK